MTFASDLHQRQQLQKQYCPIKTNIEWRFLGGKISDRFLAQTLVARKETIHLSRERRIMFIQYGNQNGFCVRPGREGGKSFEIYTHSHKISTFQAQF